MSTKLSDDKKERIAKVIAHSGLCSRRDAEKMILEGRVLVNGLITKNCATKTNNADEIIVDGEKIKKKDTIRLWKYYKPSGLITSHKDEQERKTARRDSSERRAEHRRVSHRRKSNIPIDVENRSQVDNRVNYQRKGNRRIEERRH